MQVSQHKDLSTRPAPLMTFCRIAIAPLYRLLFPIEICGNEEINGLPDNLPAIVVSNHISYFDAISIIASTKRNLHFMAKKELFDSRFGWFFRAIGLITVDRNGHDSGLLEATNYLKSGQAIAIFPEGTTKFKQPHQVLPLKYGAIRLAIATEATIVPVSIIGKPGLLKYKSSKIRFGKAYKLSKSAALEQSTDELQSRIVQLMKQSGSAKAVGLVGHPAHNPSQEPPHLVGNNKTVVR